MKRVLVPTLLAAFCLSVFAARAAVAAEAKGYGDISVEELKKAIDSKKVTVIDVNGTDAYNEGHIPGAIDFEASEEKLGDMLPQDKGALIVAYCGGPGCNAYKAAAKKAVALGYTNVKHLSAGISGWKQAGEDVEKKSG